MLSGLIRYLQVVAAHNVGTIRSTLYAIALVTVLALFLKYELLCRNYAKRFPSTKNSFLLGLGNGLDVFSNGLVKGITLTAYLLQMFMGYHQIFKHEPYFYVGLFHFPMLVLTKAKAVEEFLVRSTNLKKSWNYDWLHPWIGTGVLTSSDSKWKSRRKLLSPAFHFDILKDFMPVFNERSQQLVKHLEKETRKSWTDITDPIALCTLDIVCETTLGVSTETQKNTDSEYAKALERSYEIFMQRSIHPLYSLDWYFNLSKIGSQFKKDVKLIHSFTHSVISGRLKTINRQAATIENVDKNRRRALLDFLLAEHIEKDSLTEEGIKEESETILFTANHTLSTAIIWALYLIGLYQDVQETVHQEIDRVFGDDYERPITVDDLNNFDYLTRVLKECQRLYPTIPLFARSVTEDTAICGTEVPKGFSVLVLVYALHRDESVFPDPEKFDPDRFLPHNTANLSQYAYIPFSVGHRSCLGQRYALMEMKVVILNILRYYHLESMDPRDKVLPTFELALRAAGPIRIKLASRRETVFIN